MKFIIAVVPHHKLETLKAELMRVDVTRMTIMDVRGYGRQKGHREVFRGQEIMINFVNKLEIQIAVNDEFVQPTIDTILNVCYSGQAGDGKIFVLPLDETYRISTKEVGKAAI